MCATPYSYRSDDRVPSFPDDGPCVVMDGECALCSRGAQWIANNDSDGVFRIATMQSPLGSALLTHYGMDPRDPTSWLYLDNGEAFTSMDAIIRVGRRLGGLWKGLVLLRVLPTTLQHWLYRLVATNRYRIWGKGDLCTLPSQEIRKRLIT